MFEPIDILPFLDWFERQYTEAVAFETANAFVEGLSQPYLEAISSGAPIPQWIETMLKFRLSAQWAFQNQIPIANRISRGLDRLFTASEIEQGASWAERYKITAKDVADVPPEIRQAFAEGSRFSLSWVKRLSDDARSQIADLLSVETLKNRSPADAVPLLERLLRRELVGESLGIDPSLVTADQVAAWTRTAEMSLLDRLAFRAQMIAQTESMRMLNLGILSTLEEQGHTLAYVMPHANSCPKCRRLIDGRVFLIQVLKENLFRNFGVKKRFWVASLPQHPKCRHSAMAPPVKFRQLLPSVDIPDEGLILEWYGLPGGEAAMTALNLQKPEEGWLTLEGEIA